MNHSIKLRHGWQNLHFDAHDDGDDDDNDVNDDLEVHEVDNDADKDEDDSIKISQSLLDLHFDGRPVLVAGGPTIISVTYLADSKS